MGTAVPPALDAIDRTILREVLRDGRISIRELAERTALSTSATSERLRRLERNGHITGYRAVVAASATGRTLDAVVGVRAEPGVDRTALEAWLAAQPCVVDAVHLTGPHDYLLRMSCTSTAELDAVLMAMKAEGGVAETETRVVLRSLPVEPRII